MFDASTQIKYARLYSKGCWEGGLSVENWHFKLSCIERSVGGSKTRAYRTPPWFVTICFKYGLKGVRGWRHSIGEVNPTEISKREFYHSFTFGWSRSGRCGGLVVSVRSTRHVSCHLVLPNTSVSKAIRCFRTRETSVRPAITRFRPSKFRVKI